MTVSVIIPTYNEEDSIATTIDTVREHGENQILKIIVVDGGSNDKTVERANSCGVDVLKSPRKGRAAQMNFGAAHAEGDILYFLHADSLPPENFTSQIQSAIQQGFDAGCFQLAFDRDHVLLNFYAWCTRFDINAFRFGDQSLFITRKAFNEVGGFREDHIVMEDNEIIRRIKQQFSFKILDDSVITSARKYNQVGVLKLQLIFTLIFLLYHLGFEQSKLVSILRKAIQY
jgi:rSAM/selenodomain-associated transferase 2